MYIIKIKCISDLTFKYYQIITKNQSIDFAEILFYFQLQIAQISQGGQPINETYALVSRYSSPNAGILKKSSNTYWLCTHGRIENLEVIPVKTILSVVAMIPYKPLQNDSEQQYFVVEKPGLEVACMGGVEENIPEEF